MLPVRQCGLYGIKSQNRFRNGAGFLSYKQRYENEPSPVAAIADYPDGLP